jgi:cysteine-rich repeat protein
MNKLILTLLFLMVSNSAWATTWYVRSDGGTYATQCTGTTNAAYTSGINQPCAVKSIYEIHPHYTSPSTTSGTERIVGGDTVIFSKPSDVFPIGANRTTTPSGCTSSAPYDCNLVPFPDGTSGAYTKIYGYGHDTGCSASTKVQLYGDQGPKKIFDTANTDYIEYKCLEITDHSSCGFRTGGNRCSESYPADVGTYARDGFSGQGGSNQIYRYIDVHGLSLRAFNIGGITNITFDHVNMDGNHYGGLDGDTTPISGGTTLVDGTITLSYVNVRFNGCAETYPRSSSFSNTDYSDCTDQNDSGYGDGFGFKLVDGTFLMDNSFFGWNSSDGLDLLYQAFDVVKIDKSRFEGNIGNQWKILTTTFEMTNSITIANCNYLSLTSKIYNTGTFNVCRASGSAVIVPMQGGTYKWYNNTIHSATHSSGSAAIESANTTSTANGTETYTAKNNIYVSPNATWTLYYNGLSGSAATAWSNFSTTNSIIYNFQSNPCPSGTGNQCNTDPKFVSSVTASSGNNLASVYLQSISPAKGTGASGITFWNSSSDYNSYAQNSPVDMGALQYGSTPTSAVCGNGTTEGSEQCDDSNTNNGDGCSSTCQNETPLVITPFKGSIGGGLLKISGGNLIIN